MSYPTWYNRESLNTRLQAIWQSRMQYVRAASDVQHYRVEAGEPLRVAGERIFTIRTHLQLAATSFVDHGNPVTITAAPSPYSRSNPPSLVVNRWRWNDVFSPFTPPEQRSADRSSGRAAAEC